ncbi:MAG: hypothetical protein ACKO6B_07950 [Planctomycetia bacterium]
MRFPHVRSRFRRNPQVWLRAGAIVGTLTLATAVGTAVAQNDDPRFADWNKVELAAETRTFKEAMRGGGAFDAAARGYLEQIALPQLELESNRSKIEWVRRRMREFLLSDVVKEKAADDANKVFLDFMQTLADKQETEPVVRVNAMLLIGELQGADRKPLQAAAPVLARAASNADVPKAVRVAACVGLHRHVESTKGIVEEQQRLASVAKPAIVAILGASASPGTAVEDDWLASRCLSMLPLLGRGTPETIAEAARILGDESLSIDVRVRAAVALAAAAGPDAKIEPATFIPAIGKLAVRALERDAATADRLLLERQFGAVAGLPVATPPRPALPGMIGDPSLQPEVEQLIPREVCRRAAWRLSVLADSILTDDSKRGLAVRAAEGDVRTGFQELAQKLRRAAMELDAVPEEATLRQALADIKPPTSEESAEEKPDASGDEQ